MKVLIACEFSGIVRDAFAKLGHDVLSCDLLPTEKPGNHYQGDVREILNEKWDLMIAHPPCTYLCNSGVRWLYSQKDRWLKMEDASKFFMLLYTANIPKICIENPIPHRHANLPPYTQIIQPYMFGHGETKSTCLWLKNLPLLTPTNEVKGRKPRVHYESPGIDRWKNRSRTYTGIATAMVEQWGL